ncbi:MAG: hypothetical protein KC503_24515 [Myxococcales bacterium]|nr:hypothetical protein [Myxococcales bacterium]
MTNVGKLGGIALLAIAALSCGKKGEWLVGKWLLVDDGKPSACHEFKKDRTFTVYRGPHCAGSPDALLGGKWKMKTKTKLLLQRGKEEGAHAAIIGERKDDQFVSSGNLSGTMYKVGKDGTKGLMDKLTQKGVITMRELSGPLGCDALRVSVGDIRKLPVEKKPRMLRSADQSLQFYANTKTGNPHIEKIVYGLNQDQLDWISFQLTKDAYSAPGPGGRLAAEIGKPKDEAATGKGDKRQQISMWKAYCTKVRGSALKEIDVTLFSIPGKKQGYYYISENVVSSTWGELKAAAGDPSQQADDDDDSGSGSGTGSAAAAKKPDAPKKKKAAPEPKAKKAAPEPKKASAPKKGRATKKGGIAVPGGADEI